MTVKQIVDVFTIKPQYLSVYPDLGDLQVRTQMVEDLVKSSASNSAKASAVRDIGDALGVGWSVGDVVYTVFGNLASKPLADPVWGGTARLFANDIAVAKVYTEILNQSTTDLGTLRAVMRPVAQDSDVGTTDAIVELIGQGLMAG
jgi:hypothetical protein